MIAVNVRIVKEPETLYDAPVIDGTTQKRVEFEFRRQVEGWLYRHVIITDSRDYDRQIDKLWAHGGIGINVKEYQGDEPSIEWKHDAVRVALAKADKRLWEAGQATPGAIERPLSATAVRRRILLAPNGKVRYLHRSSTPVGLELPRHHPSQSRSGSRQSASPDQCTHLDSRVSHGSNTAYDVIIPDQFTAYQVENSLVSTALYQSGVVAQNGESPRSFMQAQSHLRFLFGPTFRISKAILPASSG